MTLSPAGSHKDEPMSEVEANAAVTSQPRHDIVEALLDRESDFRLFLRRRLSDQALADDLLQQSFMRAVQQAHTLEQPEQSVAWFYRILRNAVTDYYRAYAAANRKAEAFLQELQALGDDKTPSLDEWRPAVCACLNRLLSALRPAYADLLRRVDLNGEEPAAVAKDLGITVNNLTVRLHRARQALRNSLEKSCGICTKHGCLNCTCDEQP
jgi:RNA polymerase sigma factor (sigma-70 family)